MVTAETNIIGFVSDFSRQILGPGEKPGTKRIISSLGKQSALGLIVTKAFGIGEVAQVTITGAIGGLARVDEGRGSLLVEAHLLGRARFYERRTEFENEQTSSVSGFASVFARATEGGTARANISCVSAMIGPAG